MHGCGGGGSETAAPPAPSPAAALEAALKSGLVKVMPMAANVQSSLIFLLNPASALSQGVQLMPDNRPGAAPNSFTVNGSFDGNGDGFKETTVSGTAVFATDPATGWSAVSGQMDLAVNIPVIGHVYQANIHYTLTSAQATLWGSGTFTNPVTGITTTLNVAAGTPLAVKLATGAAGAVANACGHSLAGVAGVQAVSSAGTLSTSAAFSHDSASVAFQGTTFTASGGQATTLPDSNADLNCGSSGSLADWVATYDIRWACLPQESGEFRTTLAVGGSSTLAITDEGDTTSYPASQVGPGPHAVRGFFIAGQAPNTYREDFTWTLRKDGNFSQFSTYAWEPQVEFFGSGGVCAATAIRVP
jgi:hypothetical protein